jgi:lipopolysaccharide transport system ATP-binding protein
MAYPAIAVRHVGKTFSLSRRGSASARQALEDMVRAPFRQKPAASDPYSEGFWALRDVDFEIAAGEVVGVMGHNGAGKSVMLKLLARVTQPTLGEIEIRGTVAPLLEVGTGFHPALTGRENIYLNGVILGMRRAEVHERVDEIVAFADIGQFLDIPVRSLSSGMRMRLAFSVAAHLDREIFILDEVLAVGDSDFQAKCTARLHDLAASGRTVLLVSHGQSHIERICSRALLFDHGRLVESGAPASVAETYRELRQKAGAAR